MADVRSAPAVVTVTPLEMVPGAPVLVAKPSQFVEVAYTPALLLSVQLDAALTEHADFAQACEDGFDAYFEDLYVNASDGELVCVERVYTLTKIYAEVCADVLSFLDRRFGTEITLASSVGFALGWLSALALAQPVEAHAGLVLLEVLATEALRVRDCYLPALCGAFPF